MRRSLSLSLFYLSLVSVSPHPLSLFVFVCRCVRFLFRMLCSFGSIRSTLESKRTLLLRWSRARYYKWLSSCSTDTVTIRTQCGDNCCASVSTSAICLFVTHYCANVWESYQEYCATVHETITISLTVVIQFYLSIYLYIYPPIYLFPFISLFKPAAKLSATAVG